MYRHALADHKNSVGPASGHSETDNQHRNNPCKNQLQLRLLWTYVARTMRVFSLGQQYRAQPVVIQKQTINLAAILVKSNYNYMPALDLYSQINAHIISWSAIQGPSLYFLVANRNLITKAAAQKCTLKMSLRIPFCIHFWFGMLNFFKKVKIVVD